MELLLSQSEDGSLYTWSYRVIATVGVTFKSSIVMFEDNKARISLSEHPGNHRSSKHIDYRHLFVKEGVQRGEKKLVYKASVCRKSKRNSSGFETR